MKNILTNKVFLITAAVVIVVAVFFIYIFAPEKEIITERVYRNQDQTIALRSNGTFLVSFNDGAKISGRYNEYEEKNIKEISFTVNEATIISRFKDNVLFLPFEWDNGLGTVYYLEEPEAE
jgi:amino acid permease